MTSPAPRVLLIGLDAMDGDLIRRWAAAGILPVFRSLFERATFGPTETPPGLFVGAVWPSFFTAASPARHGRYCYEQIVSGTYTVERFPSSALKRPPFWSSLGAAGKRVAVVDVPKSPLTANLNGIQLCDWGTHDPDPGSVFETWPPSLAADLTARFGSDPIGDCNNIERTAAGIETFRRNLKHRIEKKTAICNHLLDREAWDLFLAVFPESHCVGHQCWNLHDCEHPHHDASMARLLGDPLEDIYVALDAAVGELLLRCGADTTVFILASHGMGPHYDGSFMLPEILERLDRPPGEWRRRMAAWGRRARRGVLRRLSGNHLPPAPLPVAHRRFFAIPNNDAAGGIRVNLRGREPSGRIDRGKQYDALFDELRRELLQLVDADSGRPVVREVFRLADVYAGEYLDALPDFCVEWSREAPIAGVSSPTIGTIRKQFDGVRSGDHTPAGSFWCMGPRVAPGKQVEAVSVMDFAVTVAARLGVPLADVDGRLIPGLA